MESVSLADGSVWPLLEAVCCRSWPVSGVSIGKCGYCGERPEVVGYWSERDKENRGD